MALPVAVLGGIANLEAWCKQNDWRRVTVDGTVHHGPCLIWHLRLESDGEGDADAKVYNNPGGANGDYMQLYTVDESAHDSPFMPPLYYDQGIYVDVGTNVAAVMLHFRPV